MELASVGLLLHSPPEAGAKLFKNPCKRRELRVARELISCGVAVMTTTTLLKRSGGSPRGEAASRALREAGVGVVEVEDWDDAAEEVRKCGAALVVCHGEWLESVDASRIRNAITALTGRPEENVAALPNEAARAL